MDEQPPVLFPLEETEQSVAARFELQVERHPDRLAILDSEIELSYAELNRRANRIARALRSAAPDEPARVAIYLEKGATYLTAILGVLKAGHAYVPIDPAFPRARNLFIVQDSAAAVVLTHRSYHREVADLGLTTARVLDLTEILAGAATDEDDRNLGSSISPDALAYIIYTSGSTGQPKGVMQNQRNTLHGCMRRTNLQRVTPDDRLSLFYSCSVMGSVYCIFGALLNGAALLPYDIREEGLADLARWLVERKVTIYHSVASVFRNFAATYAGVIEGNQVRLVIFGGERVLAHDVSTARQLFSPRVLFFTGLGSTETGTVRHYLIGPDTELTSRIVPIGYPVEGVEIVLTSDDGRVLPPGEVGEINVHSRYLALGYWNNPEATRRAFSEVDDQPGVRRYRMGDMAELHPSGLLEHRGRRDFQIKIRGFRVEIGEVESALQTHPLLAEGVVKAAEIGDETQLVAFVVPKPVEGSAAQSVTVRQLREFLKERLPSYMVPARYVALPALPRTPNGKIDKLALPEPLASNALPDEVRVAPVTDVERRLLALGAPLLRRDELGTNENFFDLGGDSLLATQLASRIQAVFGVRTSMRSIFEARDFRALAQIIEQSSPATPAPNAAIEARARPERIPATPAQRRMWLIDRMYGSGPAYHISNAVWLRGPLDLAALERALNDIAERHEILRTVFPSDDDGCWQRIVPHRPFSLAAQDFADLPLDEARRRARELVRQELGAPQDLAEGPLWRCAIAKVGPDEHALSLVFNHIIYDNIWSSRLLFRELDALYAFHCAGATGSSPLPPLALQFADYAGWEDRRVQGGGFEEQLAYFRKELENPPSPPEIRGDRPRPVRPTFEGGQVAFVIPAHVRVALQDFGRGESATLFMTLLAAFQLLLARYSGQPDVLVGTPTGRRYRPETEELIGLFINNLVLRARIDERQSFRQLLAEVRRVCVEAFSHDELPFEELIADLRPARSAGIAPFFQHFFIHRNGTHAAWEIDGLEVEPIKEHAGGSKFDLTLSVLETERQLSATIEYGADLFDRETIERLADNYLQLLESALENPELPVWELGLASEAERERSIRGWNQTAVDYAADHCTHARIAEVARERAGAVAIVGDRETLTYRELELRAEALAQRLRELGAGPGDLVAVCLNRSPTLVVALLAVMKSGAAYVPLDPDFPAERLTYMIEDSRARVFVSESAIARRVPAGDATVLLLDAPLAAPPLRTSALPPPRAAGPDDLAYVIYTSGSTGNPKGVQVTHRGLTNFLLAMAREPGMSSQDVMQALTTVCFDIAALELYLPLLVGARLVIADRDTALSPPKLLRSIAEQRVTIMQATPVTWRLLLESGPVPKLKVLCGGEAMGLDLAAQLLATGNEVWNLYGPTETTVWSTAARVRAADDARFVGKPIANTQLYLANSHLSLQPIGVPGELLIGGDGVARGYLGRDALTREKFVESPLAAGKRLYRTGDLAVRRADGAIEFLGRIDNQVKIRGFRIELGEIESRLATHPSVKQCVVVAREETPGDKRLVAYCIASSPGGIDPKRLQEHLKKTLPSYMLPSAYLSLDAFPQTPNGKIDRKRLPAPAAGPKLAVASSDGERAQSDVERFMIMLWQAALGRERITIDDDFFALGGDSMLAVRLLHDVYETLDLKLSLAAMFERPTIRGLLERGPTESARVGGVVELNDAVSGTPVYCFGGIRPYQQLADRLGSVPLFAVYAPQELEHIEAQKAGLPSEIELEVLADFYAEAVQRHARSGTVRLLGQCFGGLIALEVASRLRQRGLGVERVIVLGADPNDGFDGTLVRSLRDYANRAAESGVLPATRVLAARLLRRLDHEVHLLGARGATARRRRDKIAQRRAFTAMRRAVSLRDKTYDVDVLVVRATDRKGDDGRALAATERRLRRTFRGRLEVAYVRADPFDLLRGPAADAVFDIVSKYVSSRVSSN